MKNLETNNTAQTSNENPSNNKKRNIAFIIMAMLSIAIFISAKPFLTNVNNYDNLVINSEKEEYKFEDFVLSEDEIVEFEITEIENLDNNENTTKSSLIDITESTRNILEEVKEQNIFHISSTKPDGFYIMVGSFSVYKNALTLQNNNPTQLACYIFEPNGNDLNRVGLFVSETDLQKAKKVLSKVKMMQPQSWIIYNSLK